MLTFTNFSLKPTNSLHFTFRNFDAIPHHSYFGSFVGVTGPRFALLLWGVKTVLVLALYLFQTASNLLDFKIISATYIGLMLLSFAILYCYVVYYLPFYNQNVNLDRSIITSACFGIAIVSFIFNFAPPTYPSYLPVILMVIIGILFALAGSFLCYRRSRHLYK